MKNNPYKVLGVSPTSSYEEIKIAFRELVKRYHPDAGGDEIKILSINAAWEVLKDNEKRKAFDIKNNSYKQFLEETNTTSSKAYSDNNNAKDKYSKSSAIDIEISNWIKNVYSPIDKLIASILNPFPGKIKELSADPYDDVLMEDFCSYLDKSIKKLEKISIIYTSITTPNSLKEISLLLYHCFSQVEDGIKEFERFSMGYVDNYLHDGKEMLREAKKKLILLRKEKQKLCY